MTARTLTCFQLDSSSSNPTHNIISNVQHIGYLQSADHEYANQQHISDEAEYQNIDGLKDEPIYHDSACNEPPMQLVISEHDFVNEVVNSSSLNQQQATDNAKHTAVYYLLLYYRDVILSHK